MSNAEDFQNCLEEINAIPPEKIQKPNYPMDIYLQECEILYKRVQKDAPLLYPVGITDEMIEHLPVRIGACREAQSIWMDFYRTRQEIMQIWLDKSPEAYKLRNELIDTFIFAFNENQQLVNRIRMITKSNKHTDMIQNLNDLSVLGKKNSEKLSIINYDLSLLDKAAELSDKMASLLAEVNENKMELHEYLIKRNMAYSYLRELVVKLRKCGKYVFRNDKRLQKAYTIEYFRQKGRKASKKEVPDINLCKPI